MRAAWALALGALACASPRRAFTVEVNADASTLAAATEASAMWERATPAVRIAVGGSGEADVVVSWAPLEAGTCADEVEHAGSPARIHLGLGMTERCRARLASVIAHELGHYMADRDEHLGPGTLMHDSAGDAALGPTPADVDYLSP